MSASDIAIIIVAFLLFDIIFYLVVVKGMMVQSIIGKEDPRKRRNRHDPHIEIEVLYAPAMAEAGAVVSRAAGGGEISTNTDSDSLLQQELAKLTLEKIDFHPPTDLMVGIPTKIKAVLDQDFSHPLREAVSKINSPKVRTLAVGTYIKTSLRSDIMDIKPIVDEEQNIKPGQSTWEWEVIPYKSGKRILGMDLTVRVQIPTGEQEKTFSWPGGEIQINANPVYVMVQFVKKYWLGVLIGLGVAAGALAYALLS